MKSILINIARLNLCRTFWHKFRSKYSDDECRDAFVAAMNRQAKEWGMNNTRWINPSGLGENGLYSYSTANDLAIMAMRVFGEYQTKKFFGPEACEMHIKKPYFIPGCQHKRKRIYSTTRVETIGDNFPIIGAKTGSGDGYQTLVMVCGIGEYVVSGAIMNADDENGRFEAMDELIRIGYKMLYENSESPKFKVKKAKNACLYVKEAPGKIKCLFAQNADDPSAPMSTSKVMSLAIASEFLDVDAEEYIISKDTKNAGNDFLHEWDKLSCRDLINAMMMESSNVAANALARIVGEKILKQKQQ